jgi:hypothetical protein
MIRKKLNKILEEINELHPKMSATVKKEPKVMKMNIGNSTFFNQASEEVEGVIVEAVLHKSKLENMIRKLELKLRKEKDPEKIRKLYQQIQSLKSIVAKPEETDGRIDKKEEKLAEGLINEYKIDVNAKPRPSATGTSFIKLAKDVDKSKMQRDPSKLVDKDGNFIQKPAEPKSKSEEIFDRLKQKAEDIKKKKEEK